MTAANPTLQVVETPVTIVEAMARVMGDVQAVGKDQQNTQQNYSFRGVDAVVNAVGPALRKHGVLVIPTVEDAAYRDVLVGKNQTPQRECTVRVRYTFYGPAGDSMESVVAAEALDSGDKATAKAHSVAFRTCLLQVFSIPTHDMDPDASSPERAPQEPILTPLQQAWKRTREAIERGVPKTTAARIAQDLQADVQTPEGALLVADAVEAFEKTGELPQAPEDAQEPPGEDEPAGNGESLASRLYAAADAAEGAFGDLLNRAYVVVSQQHWEDTDVKAVLGSNKRRMDKALMALDAGDLERAVLGLEDAAKAVTS